MLALNQHLTKIRRLGNAGKFGEISATQYTRSRAVGNGLSSISPGTQRPSIFHHPHGHAMEERRNAIGGY